MRIGLIVNTVAGGGKALRKLPSLVARLQRAEHTVHLAVVERPGAGIADARRLLDGGIETLLAVGGDGTLNEVLNGLIQSSADVPLEFVPAGRGSDAARSFPPISPDRHVSTPSVRALANWRPIDVGWVERESGERRFFLNVAGIGFDAAVARRTYRARYFGSTIPYFTASVRELRTLQSIQMVLHAGTHRVERELLAAIFANGRWFGGGMRIAPDAVVDDGQLDVVTIDALSRTSLVRSFARVYRGTHLSHPAVTTFRAANIEISPACAGPAHVDGEYVGNDVVGVGTLPAAQRWVWPE